MTAVRTAPVAWLVTVTTTPGSTPPLLSVAVPEMIPRVNCAHAGKAHASIARHTSARRPARILDIEPPEKRGAAPQMHAAGRRHRDVGIHPDISFMTPLAMPGI
ncbi:hypothetical protein TBR22_A31400 [Luteitalea sp. TBR-22]|nr:hypothetical protein TBR22_A31400 [Luteitalea sp. TBR-22]